MSENNKLQNLATLLQDILFEDFTNTEEFPFVVIAGDIDGKGIIWKGQGYNKQIIFSANPDRFFISENIDLAKGKGISINAIKLLDEKELGPTVTKSNLRQVGHLRNLVVDGGISIGEFLVFDNETNRLGVGTDQPNAAVSIVDQNIELVLGASQPNTASIGTFNSATLDLITDNTSRISVSANGEITLGNFANGPTKVSVLGVMGINVNSIDPRADLHVNGAIKFNNKLHLIGSSFPQNGAHTAGDIIWNSEPQPGRCIGWVCTKAGEPGLWSGFGKIE